MSRGLTMYFCSFVNHLSCLVACQKIHVVPVHGQVPFQVVHVNADVDHRNGWTLKSRTVYNDSVERSHVNNGHVGRLVAVDQVRELLILWRTYLLLLVMHHPNHQPVST